jgi:HEAT repeat protein
MNVLWALQSLFTWGLAGVVCDTRQAKRLFPLFGAAAVLGLAVGGLITRPLVSVLGSTNLILVWAAGLVIVFFIARELMQDVPVSNVSSSVKRRSMLGEIKEGYRFTKDSNLFRWMAIAAVFLAILYFSIVFPFSVAAASEFPDEDALAGFLGVFQGISSAVSILASLFLANRLYARFGLMATILVYPIIYLVGFSILSINASFALLVAFRLIQIVWSYGIADGANQAMYNVAPQEKLEQTRTFVRGVANQFGVSLAGVLLLVGQQVLDFEAQHYFFIGAITAAITTALVWRAKNAYGPAVVAALRAGQSHLFFSEEEPFGGFQQDAAAVSAAVAGIASTDVAVRRVSAEILGNLSLPEATQALVGALDDEDASVRAASLKAISSANASTALLEVASGLDDPEPGVRLSAVEAVERLAGFPNGLRRYIRPKLQDPDPAVRGRSAVVLLQASGDQEAQNTLMNMAADDNIETRIEALKAMAIWGSNTAYDMAAPALTDPRPAVRRHAARVLAHIDAAQCIFPLVNALGDSDRAVRLSVAKALGSVGEPALDPTVNALQSPKRESGALLALEYLPARRAAEKIENYAEANVNKALYYHNLWLDCRQFSRAVEPNDNLAIPSPNGDNTELPERFALLLDALRDKSLLYGTNAIKASGLLGNSAAISLALENLNSRDPRQRANALETLESVGNSEIVRPLIPLWELPVSSRAPSPTWFIEVLQDSDPWLRACAAFAASGQDASAISDQLKHLAETDTDLLVRESAYIALDGGQEMDTLATLSVMERILFLRRVPLFADLPPSDLKQIAAIAGEMLFMDGERIVEQGEPGEVMYVIVSGEVEVAVAVEDASETIVRKALSGEYVGEMAIISNEDRSASLIASGEVRLLGISQGEFEEILYARPETSMAVMRVLCDRLRESTASQAVVT